MAVRQLQGHDGDYASLLPYGDLLYDRFCLDFHPSPTVLRDQPDNASYDIVGVYGSDIPTADGVWGAAGLLYDDTAVVYRVDDDYSRPDADDVERNALYKYIENEFLLFSCENS